MSFFLKLGGATIVVLVAAVLVVPSFINWNQYKTEIVQPIRELTGRNLEITGDVNFALLPSPTFSAHGLRLANIDGGQAASLASVESLEINVAFLPLLGGRIDVTSILLNQPVVALETLADGTVNWTFAGARPAGKDVSSRGRPAEQGPAVDIGFSEVAIVGGAVSFYDGASGQTRRLEDIDAIVSATSLDGPYAAKGTAVVEEVPVRFEVLVGNLTSSRAVPISFSVGVGESGAKVVFAGWANELTADARLNGRLTLEGDSVAAVVGDVMSLIGVDAALPMARSRALAQSFSGEAQVVASTRELRFRNLSVRLGESVATGAFQMSLENGKTFDGSLEIPSMDLDRWLPVPDAGADGVSAADETGTDITTGGWETPFEFPSDLSGTFEVSVGAISYRGGVARQIGVKVRAGDGRLGIESAHALLPGGSAVDLTGVLGSRNGDPQFSGRIEASSNNLRGLLSWLGVNVEQVPVDRLTRLSFVSSFDVSPDVVRAYGAEIALDTMRATGGVSLALRDRLAFGVDLTIDDLNLDTYFPGSGAGEDGAPAGPGANGHGTTSHGATRLTDLKRSLAILDEFDANVRLQIGKIVLNGVAAENITLDGVLYDGELTVTKASVGDVRGAGLSLHGNATGFSRKPSIDIDLDFDLRRPSTLSALMGQPLPYPVSKFGAGKGTLKLVGGEDRVTGRLDGDFAGTRIAFEGSVVAPTASPALDLGLNLENKSLAGLIRQFDLPLSAPKGRDDGPVSLAFSTTGKIDDVKLRLEARAGGGELVIAGRVRRVFTEPDYVFDLDLKSADLKKFLRGLGMDFRPAAANLGGLSAALVVKGGNAEAAVSNLKGNVGPVEFQGAGRLNFTGDRPRLHGSLTLSKVTADSFLPADGAGQKNGKTGTGTRRPGRWSREPIDVSYLRDFDAEVTITSPGVLVGAYDFRDLRAVIAVNDGVATVKPLSARLFDGEAELSIRLDAREMPALEVEIALTNADVAKAVAAMAGIQVLTGRAGIKGEFRTAGRSPREMIAALTGGARISAREGVIRGIDLRQLSDRLDDIKKISDLPGLITGSLSGGQTEYRSVEAAIRVEKGVARTTDIRADIDAVDATITSEIDLVNWTMDTRTRFALIDHPDAPPLGIDFRGSIDDPVRDLGTRELESYLTRLVGTAVLNQLIGPTPAPASGATSAPASPQPPTPEDVLRGIFKTLP